jgi:hypothetical protein
MALLKKASEENLLLRHFYVKLPKTVNAPVVMQTGTTPIDYAIVGP